MTSQAMQTALDQIADAFRPERAARKQVLLQGHRVQELVEAGRYTFPEACRLMNVDAKTVDAALLWLLDDNARMNNLYPISPSSQQPFDYVMVGWFAEKSQQQTTAQVIDFMTAINKAQAMQSEIAK